MKKKVIALVLVCVLVFGIAVGGTLAWLADKTETVTNTFTTSDVSLTLEETATNFKMVPGENITKDPIITVGTDSEDCYVFVKIEKSANYATYLAEYEMADGWTLVEDGVYYREAEAKDSFHVLKNDKVTVLTTVTKAQMETAKTSAPTLAFTAYAVQKDNVVAEGEKSAVEVAWGIAQGLDA